jgi:DNA topoisomerase-1
MTVIICEKNSSAQRIATILSDGKSKISKINNVRVYDFERNNTQYKIVGLRGHIVNLDYPKEFARWKDDNLRDMIRQVPIKKIQAQNIISVLKKLVKENNNVIIATDYDREGELIGSESLEQLELEVADIKAKRARFSALTKPEIENAFNNLTELDKNLSESAESRQIIDLHWGASLTRFISLASKQHGKDFLSVGRVQTPTLALIVDRDNEIKKFVPEPYWEIVATLKKNIQFTAKHAEDRFKDKAKAESVHENASKSKEAVITKIKKEEKQNWPPSPFNTTEFLRAATALRFSAANAMSIAEDLYNNGWISYPRTDNTVYPRTLSLKYILETLKKSDEFKKEAEEILAQDKIIPSKGKTQTTDHPPIYPVRAAKKNKLNSQEWKIYELIVRRFLATLAPPALEETAKVDLEINKEPFKADGLKILKPGWQKYYPYFKIKDKKLPEMTEGEKVPVIKIELLDKETKPPKRHSQGGLIQEMDKLGLGTKSTRHEIIQKLYDRGYVVESPPAPTETGIALTLALENYADTITKPEMTAILEKDMFEIAEGRKSKEDVIKESQDMLDGVLGILEENKDNIGKKLQEALATRHSVGKCIKCGGEMLIRSSRRGKRFIGCSSYPNCDLTYPLPQQGKILTTQNTCNTCGAPIVKIINKNHKPWMLCINIDCESKKNNNFKKKNVG